MLRAAIQDLFPASASKRKRRKARKRKSGQLAPNPVFRRIPINSGNKSCRCFLRTSSAAPELPAPRGTGTIFVLLFQFPYEAVECAARIFVVAHDLAAGIDSEREGFYSPGDIYTCERGLI